jgi:hypothetical protein
MQGGRPDDRNVTDRAVVEPAVAPAWFHRQFDERPTGAPIEIVGEGALPSVHAVTDFATGAVAAAATATNRLVEVLGGGTRSITVDRRLASLWFGWTLRPDGWTVPGPWDPVAGDYPTADGWIRLHTNAPHHRDAALRVLGVEPDRAAVATAVARWDGSDLEQAVVEGGGCAAQMRSAASWAAHAQGAVVAAEPLLGRRSTASAALRRALGATPERPLAGVRVLDLTRVLAGPVATRFLAALGADVIRLDPPAWDEPAVAPEVTLGKRCHRVDARTTAGGDVVRSLLRDADIVVHGYRPGALAGLGLDEARRTELAPGLVDVSLCAYGWTGPWTGRRGFDSLVQMSCGIAHAGMIQSGGERPFPLPVQALDHATGYLLAMAAIDGWTDRLTTGGGTVATASLARSATLLMRGPVGDLGGRIEPASPDDERPEVEATSWGPAHRLRPPVEIDGVPLRWTRGASALGSTPGPPTWSL